MNYLLIIGVSEIVLGIVLGYFLLKFAAGKKSGQRGLLPSLAFNVGSYRIHLHHWLLSLGILFSHFFFGLSLPWPPFSTGFLLGSVWQGIRCYSDWRNIISRV